MLYLKIFKFFLHIKRINFHKNDLFCQIEVIGYIKIHMFDEIRCIFTHVRFISNMKNKLISLYLMDKKLVCK